MALDSGSYKLNVFCKLALKLLYTLTYTGSVQKFVLDCLISFVATISLENSYRDNRETKNLSNDAGLDYS